MGDSDSVTSLMKMPMATASPLRVPLSSVVFVRTKSTGPISMISKVQQDNLRVEHRSSLTRWLRFLSRTRLKGSGS